MLSGFFGLATAAIGCNFAYPSEQVKFLFLLRALARLSLSEFLGEPCVPTFRWFCERASARRSHPDGDGYYSSAV